LDRDRNGSPPRTWGTHSADKLLNLSRRFTPTHVGNTWGHQISKPTLLVHPHARGEHWPINRPAFVGFGSPPRTWGTQPHCRITSPLNRFTPTHVGNTGP